MTGKKTIVFHIPKWYPNRYDSLLGVFVKRHILSTLHATIPVVIYVMASQSSDQWYELEESTEEGILTYRCYYKKNITGIDAVDKLIKLLLYFGLTFKIYRKAKRQIGKPCLVHAHVLLRTAVAARLIEIFDRVPYILIEHSSTFIRQEVKAFNKVTLFLARHVVKKAKVVITVSECLAKGMRERYGLFNKQYRVIYNGVNDKIFFEKDILPVRSLKELVYVAEFDDTSKNISGLLHAIANLYEKRKDFRLSLVGYGKDETKLRALADQLMINNKAVFFTGKLKAEEVASYIQQADALLMFSHFETLSCIVTESLCCGTPVISTAVGGIVEIVNLGNGLLIPKADQAAMQKAIEKILDYAVTFDKHKVSSTARAMFSYEAVGEKLVAVYKEVSAC
ncbi:MAG: glycosyltransferase family 4 protein [Chitinophagaceae bacterium]|nr:glycosyltransferase family 4 protein [Chitinophagaceae bacterium]